MKKNKKQENKLNKEISRYGKVKEVRVVSSSCGVENGVYKFEEALKIAIDNDLDLIEINGNIDIPICRIEDYNKFLYNKKKQKKEQDKKNKANAQKIKELRFGPNTDKHDFDFKLEHAINFLKNGDKLKAYVFFKGREIAFKDKGQILLLRLAEALEEYGVVESMPKLEGKKMIMFIKPKKKK